MSLKERIRELWEKKWKDYEIARELGITGQYVWLVRKKMGLKGHGRRGRPENNILHDELDKHKAVFEKDYTKLIRLSLRKEHLRNGLEVSRISVPKLIMPKGKSNIMKQIIYCKRGDEETAFGAYVNRLPEYARSYFVQNRRIAVMRLNRVRGFFRLPKDNNVVVRFKSKSKP